MRGLISKTIGAFALCTAGVAFAPSAHALPPQRINNAALTSHGINPFYYVTPGLTLPQYYYNNAVIANSLRQYPPWLFGYNPYPQPILYGGYPTIPYNSMYTPQLYSVPNAYISPYGGLSPYTTLSPGF